MKTSVLFILLASAFSVALTPNVTEGSQELGIDRSGLSNQSAAVQEKTLQDIHALHATWFRDGPSASIAGFVNEVRLARQSGLKVLFPVGPSYTDFKTSPPNAGENFRKMCGWPQGSEQLSQLDVVKFTQHFRATLDAIKAANLTIDAFEIGNEYDAICFNGDVPDGHAASEQELMTALRGYGEFLKAALVIRDPRYFPKAKIITFGIAHGSDKWDNPPHHISHPAQFVARLRNVDGFNYLDNSFYHIDGYGTHIYPWPTDIAGSVRGTLKEDAAALGDKPLWVTEFGFLTHSQFPNQKGQTLEQGLQEMLTTFDSLASTVSLGPLMFYSYNGWLTDNAGQLQPEAAVLSAYAEKKQAKGNEGP